MTTLGDIRCTLRDLIAQDESIGATVQERIECLHRVIVELRDYEISMGKAFEDLKGSSNIDSGHEG